MTLKSGFVGLFIYVGDSQGEIMLPVIFSLKISKQLLQTQSENHKLGRLKRSGQRDDVLYE